MAGTAIPMLIVTRAGGVLHSETTGTDVYVEDNDGNCVVRVRNSTGSPVTITLEPAVTLVGLSIAGPTIEVANGADIWVGPLPPAVFNNGRAEAHISDPSGALLFTALRF